MPDAYNCLFRAWNYDLFSSSSSQDAQSYAEDNSLLFMETSAKTSMNVNEIFMAIGKLLTTLNYYFFV